MIVLGVEIVPDVVVSDKMSITLKLSASVRYPVDVLLDVVVDVLADALAGEIIGIVSDDIGADVWGGLEANGFETVMTALEFVTPASWRGFD